MKIKVCTFDVFDTCLVRRVAVPSFLFYKVALKVFNQLKIPINKHLLEEFVSARVKAENIARQNSNVEDVSLFKIWEVLFRLMGWKADEELINAELQTENENLCPISTVREIVQQSRREGLRIVFVSDMYLPSEFIEKQLEKHGFAQPGDGIYVSSEIGKTKASGSLYKHVLDQEAVSPLEIKHIGDNLKSDYSVPRSLGIQADLFTESQMTNAEMMLLESSIEPSTSSVIAGAMRAARLSASSDDEETNELASQFVTPFVMAYAIWVLRQAQKDGITRLYFLSRDCQLVWKVSKQLSSYYGNIDCRYLYVSRQALYLPSSSEITPEGMPWMRRSFEEPILKNLLAKLDLNYEEEKSLLMSLAGNQGERYRLTTDKDWSLFWELLNHESLKAKIYNTIKCRRETAREYFESEGLLDDQPWRIVDLGWYLTGQQALTKILKIFGYESNVQGYYLGLKKDRLGHFEAGQSKAMFYENHYDDLFKNKKPDLFFYQTLIEHIIGIAEHPSVHHYEKNRNGKSAPYFFEDVSIELLSLCKNIHSKVLETVIKNKDIANLFNDLNCCTQTISVVSSCFLRFPGYKSVRSLLKLSCSIDQNSLDSKPIVAALRFSDVFMYLFYRRGANRNMWENINCSWPEGSMMITPFRTKIMIKAVYYLTTKISHYKHIIKQML